MSAVMYLVMYLDLYVTGLLTILGKSIANNDTNTIR